MFKVSLNTLRNILKCSKIILCQLLCSGCPLGTRWLWTVIHFAPAVPLEPNGSGQWSILLQLSPWSQMAADTDPFCLWCLVCTVSLLPLPCRALVFATANNYSPVQFAIPLCIPELGHLIFIRIQWCPIKINWIFGQNLVEIGNFDCA